MRIAEQLPIANNDRPRIPILYAFVRQGIVSAPNICGRIDGTVL